CHGSNETARGRRRRTAKKSPSPHAQGLGDRAAKVRGANLLRRQGPRQPALLSLQGAGALPHWAHGWFVYPGRRPEGIRKALSPGAFNARRPGRVRPAALDGRAGAERVAPGRQTALRSPQETPPQRMDASPDE